MLRDTISYNDEIADKFGAKPSMMKHPAFAPRLVCNVNGHLIYPSYYHERDFKIVLYFCFVNPENGEKLSVMIGPALLLQQFGPFR